MKRDYELGIIFNPEASEEETRAILNRLEQIVTTYGGQTVRVQQWGRRRLAYLIERHRDGFYVFLDLILTPETVSELDRTLKVSEIVLRYMFKRRDPKAVQLEREARSNAAANAPTTEATEENQQEAAEDTSVDAEQEAPEVPTEDFAEVPPALEEEVVEA